MKKLYLFLILSAFILLLFACQTQGKMMVPNKNNMILNIKNNANFDIYELKYSVYKNGNLKRGGGTANADGSKIPKGEELRKEFRDQEGIRLEGEAKFKFTLVGEKGNEIPLKGTTLELATDRVYYFEITGDSIKDAKLKRIAK